MEYKKSIKALDELRNAEIEVMRHSDPRKATGLVSYPIADVDNMKKVAIEREKSGRGKMHLHALTQLINYKSFYSEAMEDAIDKLNEVKERTDLAEIISEEQAELLPFINEMKQVVATELEEAKRKIQEIVNETEEKLKPTIKSLSKIELYEEYLHTCNNYPICSHIRGAHLYVPSLKPIMNRHSQRNGTVMLKTYTGLNIKDDILRGIK